MKALRRARAILPMGLILLVFFFTSCSGAVYVYQNGTTYNDYEVATNYRIKSATKRPKISSSKAPNWKKYNQQQKFKRYN